MGRFYTDANEALLAGRSWTPRVLISKDVVPVLQATVTSADLYVIIQNGTGVAVRDVVVFDTEGMRVNAISVGASTTTLTVTRGFDGAPAAHTVAVQGLVYLDLSNKIDHDRVITIPGLQATLEKSRNSASIPSGTITLDNEDRFWNARPPTGITSWNTCTVRISIVTQGGALPVNHFLVTGITTDSGPDAVLSLTGLATALTRQDASIVRNGQQWWENVPAWWIAQQVLLTVYPQTTINSWIASGSLITALEIPLAAAYPVRASSPYGQLADWRGSGVFSPVPQQVYGNAMCVVPTTGSPPNNLAGQTLVGVGSDLYARHPATRVWTRLGGFGALYPNHKIMHVWWDATYNGYVGVGWELDIPADTQTGPAHRSGAKNGVVTFFRGNGEASNGTPTNNAFLVFAAPSNAHDAWDETTPEYITTGHYAVRYGGYKSGSPNDSCSVGAFMNSLYAFDNAKSFGINIPLPQGSWCETTVHNGNGGSAITQFDTFDDTSGTDLHAGVNVNPVTNYWENIGPGYFALQTFSTTDRRPLDVRFSIGQHAGCFAMKTAGGLLAFASIRWDSTSKSYKYNLWTLTTTSGTVTGGNIVAPTYTKRDGSGIFNVSSFGQFQPYSLDWLSDDTKLLVAGAFWNEAPWSGGAPAANQAVGCVVEMNATTWASSALAFQSSSFTTDIKSGMLPVRAMYTAAAGAGRAWIVSGLNYKGVGTGAQHLTFLMGTGGATYGKVRSTPGRHAGFCWDTDLSRVYWHESDTNIVVSLGCTDVANDATMEDAGLSPVEEDRSLLMGLVYDPTYKRLYGVSGGGQGAQANAEIMDAPVTARNLFWQFANGLTDYIALAPFDDTDAWTALDWIAAFFDGVRTFLPDGRFYLNARPTATTLSMRIKDSGFADYQTYLANKITVDMGLDEIVNYAEVPWSRVVQGVPTGTQRVLARPSGFERDQTDTQIVPMALNTHKQHLYLRCVQGGVTGAEDRGCLARTRKGTALSDTGPATSVHFLRFAYLVVDRYVRSQLLADVISGATTMRVPIQAVADTPVASAVDFGDTLELTGSTSNTTETFTITAVVRVEAGAYATITLDHATTQAYPASTPVTIRSFRNNRWSDHASGVATLSANVTAVASVIYPTSVEHLSPLQVIRFDSANGFEEMRILTIDRSTRACTVRRGLTTVSGTGIAHTAGETFKAYVAPLIQKQAVTHLSAALNNTSTTASVDSGAGWNIGDTAIIDNESMTVTGGAGEGSTSFTLSRPFPVSHLTKSEVRQIGMFAPETFFGVGNTGVGLRFDLGANDLPFMVGDELDITCPGSTLQEQSDSPAVAWNMTTFQKMKGRKVRWEQGRKCPFMTHRIATELARTAVDDDGYGKAHFIITAEMPFVVAAPPVLGTALGFENPACLPALDGGSPNGDTPARAPDQLLSVAAGTRPTVGAMVRSYEIDPQSERVTIVARAIHPHPL